MVTAEHPGFGRINLEDISAPRCFEIERRLRERLDIPVFHDDQHGTAIVTLAALFNALRVVGKRPNEVTVVVTGAGAEGLACAEILLAQGIGTVAVCDVDGAFHPGRPDSIPRAKRLPAGPTPKAGAADELLRGADVFLNVLALPGVFRDALDVGATTITESMKLAAARAIADAVSDEELALGRIVPSVLDPAIAPAVGEAVAPAAVADGVARRAPAAD